MKYIIDRFEENIAICENEVGIIIQFKRERLPKEASEGDVIILQNEIFSIDKAETKKRKIEIEALMKELWKD